MITSNNIDFKEERDYKKDIGILNSIDFFELSRPKNVKIVIFEHRVHFIIHANRDIEKALIQGKKEKDSFLSTKYLIMDANVLSDIPMIKTVDNFNCLHSYEEIEEYYNDLIYDSEKEIERLNSIKDRILEDDKFIFPERSSLDFSRTTNPDIFCKR